jgi:hypothetical protein
MSGEDLVKFLVLLRETGGLDLYWKNRITEVIKKLGG